MGEGQSKPRLVTTHGAPSQGMVRATGSINTQQLNMAELQKRCVPAPLQNGYKAPTEAERKADAIQDLKARCVPKGLRNEDAQGAAAPVAAPSAVAPAAIPMKPNAQPQPHTGFRADSIYRAGKEADSSRAQQPTQQGSWAPGRSDSTQAPQIVTAIAAPVPVPLSELPRSASTYRAARQADSAVPQQTPIQGSARAPTVPRSDSMYRSGGSALAPSGPALVPSVPHSDSMHRPGGSSLLPGGGSTVVPSFDSMYNAGKPVDASAKQHMQLGGGSMLMPNFATHGRHCPAAPQRLESSTRRADHSPAPKPKPVLEAATPQTPVQVVAPPSFRAVQRSESAISARTPVKRFASSSTAPASVQRGESVHAPRATDRGHLSRTPISFTPAMRSESTCRSPDARRSPLAGRRIGEQSDASAMPQKSLSAVPAVSSRGQPTAMHRAPSTTERSVQYSLSAVPTPIKGDPRSPDPMNRSRRAADMHESVIYRPQKAPEQVQPSSHGTSAWTAAPSTMIPSPTTDQHQGAIATPKKQVLGKMWEDALARSKRRQAQRADGSHTPAPSGSALEISELKQTLENLASTQAGTCLADPDPANVTARPNDYVDLLTVTVKPQESHRAQSPVVTRPQSPVMTRPRVVKVPETIPNSSWAQQSARPVDSARPTVRSASVQMPVAATPIKQGYMSPTTMAPRGALLTSTGRSMQAPIGQPQVVKLVQPKCEDALSKSVPAQLNAGYLTPAHPTQAKIFGTPTPTKAGDVTPAPATPARILGLKRLGQCETNSNTDSTETLLATDTRSALCANDIRQIPTPAHLKAQVVEGYMLAN